ncbi:MAG TPA: hypothetical protein VIJ25_00365 [Methylococcales bacterium]
MPKNKPTIPATPKRTRAIPSKLPRNLMFPLTSFIRELIGFISINIIMSLSINKYKNIMAMQN